MPIYMDRHIMPEGMTPEEVEQAHHADMQAQHKHGVNFLTYWFDPTDGTAFCLCDAPDEDSLINVHSEAHGSIPHEIVAVDLEEVGKFLGRIEDPAADEDGRIKVDSAFRSVIFTDLKGSTDMISLLGDHKAIELFEIHDSMTRKEIEKHGGREVKTTGDGFLISFTSVIDSVRCAIDIQRAFHAYNQQTPRQPLQVRVGINAGHPIERSGDLFGMVVNLAARFCDHANPDQIVTTGIIYELCAAEPALQAVFEEKDRSYFKGFVYATQVYEILWDEKS